ncbi:MAG TPA: hypothetical protein VIW24_20780 [Aldersonia sp.]
MANFEALLAEPPFVLAEAAAIAEFGNGIHHVPSGDGVERPELLEEIARRFDNVRTRDVRRCSLTGMSGIGKSRMAAMYAHREREAYDRVCWIDASSEASIIASITNQARTIGVDLLDKLTSEEIAPAFRECIGRFTGRWLIVFDDARDSRLLEPWTPHAGTAHVLVTSTNSVDWTAFEPVPVRPMDQPQSIQLLRSRLADDLHTTEPGDQVLLDGALARLADKLERWPLALQIAAAHFGTTSSVVQGVGAYLSQIAAYVIDDETLDRDGYPRTLQAAINICLDRLAASGRTESASETGLRMLAASSVLASRAIPEVLLFAIATVPPHTLVERDGRHVIPDTDLPLVDRAIRRIRRESLIERGDGLDATAPWELRVHVDVNEIVQRIMRQRVDLGVVLNMSAGHVSTWLVHFLTRQDFSSAIALQPHALAILQLAEGVDEEDLRWCALLAGNQSALLDLQGKSADAKDWLLFELRLLQRFPRPHFRLIAKTADQIAQSLIHLGSPGEEIESYADVATSALERAAHAGDIDWDGEGVRWNLLEYVRALTRKAQHEGRSGHSLSGLQQRLDSMRSTFPGFAGDQQHALARAVDNDLDHGRDESALAGARRLLQEVVAPNDHRGRLDARVREIEALAMLGDVGEIQSRLADFAADRDRHPAVKASLASGLLDTAAAIEMRIILGLTGEQDRSVIAQLLRVSSVLLVSDYDRYRHALLAACEGSHHDDANGVRQLLQVAESVKPTALPETVRSNVMMENIAEWLEYWLECAEKGSQARAVACDAHRRRLYTAGDGLKSIRLYLVVSALTPELGRASTKPGDYKGTWRRRMLGYERALDLRQAATGRPVACILIDPPDSDDNRLADPLDWIDNDHSVVHYEVVLKSSTTSNDDLVIAIT